MALNTVKVTGAFQKPSGQSLMDGIVVFTLRGYLDSGGVATGPVEVVERLGVDGSFEINVTPNENITGDTVYSVVFYETEYSYTKRLNGYSVGSVYVPNKDVALSDIMPYQYLRDANQSRWVDLVIGDSFSVGCIMLDTYGKPLDLTGFTVASSCSLGGDYVSITTALDVDRTTGRFTLSIPFVTTSTMTEGLWDFDVKFSSGSMIKHSRKGKINVIKGVTP